MTRKKIIKKAPQDATSLFSIGNGKVAFYKNGENLEAIKVSKEFSFKKIIPGEKMFIAYKKNNKWQWPSNKYKEAIKLLTKLKYIWKSDKIKWIKTKS